MFIWYGMENIARSSMANTKNKNPFEEFSSSNSYQPQSYNDDFNPSSKLIHKLRQEFAFQSTSNIFAGVIASVSVLIAKSDGHISRDEMEAIRFAISTKLGDNVDHQYVRKIVDVTKEYLDTIHKQQLLQSILDVVNLYLNLIDVLVQEEADTLTLLVFSSIYEVAIADGGIHMQEEILFQRICNHFRIPFDYQAQIKRSAYYSYNARKSRQRSENSNYTSYQADVDAEKFQASIELFDLQDDYTEQDLEKAWKKFIMMYHPDKHHNAAPEIYELMNKRFVEAKDVYNYLKGYIGKTRPSKS
ncbi:MAG: TerB family tellurite resistance protein [Spirochaetota bacterium]